MEQNFVSQVFLPASLFLIMLGLGMTLVKDDFKRLVVYPSATILGVSLQIVVLPLIGFAIAHFMVRDNPTLAMGIMVLAACPGGATSNLITYLAKGEMALSVTLTAISSVLAVVTIPLIVSFGMDWFMSSEQAIKPPIGELIGSVVAVTILPVVMGMFIRGKSEAFAEKAEKPMKILSSVLLAVIVLGLVAKQIDQIPDFFRQAGLPTLILNLSMLTIGFFAGLIARLPLRERVSMSIEAGIQNGTLGIAIAAGILGSEAMAIPPAIYSLVMFITGFAAIAIFSRLVDKAEREQQAIA